MLGFDPTTRLPPAAPAADPLAWSIARVSIAAAILAAIILWLAM